MSKVVYSSLRKIHRRATKRHLLVWDQTVLPANK